MSRYAFRNNNQNYNKPTDVAIKFEKHKSRHQLQNILKEQLPSCIQQVKQDPEQQVQRSNMFRRTDKSFNKTNNSLKNGKMRQMKKTVTSHQKKGYSKQKSKTIVSTGKNQKKNLTPSKNNIDHKFSIIKVLENQNPSKSYRYKNIENEPKLSSLQQIKIKITELVGKVQQQAQKNQNSHTFKIKLYPQEDKQKLSVTDQFLLSGYIKLYLKQTKSNIGLNLRVSDQLSHLRATWQLYQLKLKLCPDIWGKQDNKVFRQMKLLNQQIIQGSQGKKQVNVRNLMKKFSAIITS